MGSTKLPEDQQRLIDRLRHDALASRPAFSAALHERLLRAIRERQTSLGSPKGKTPWMRRWVLVASAAAVLAALLMVWHWGYGPRETPSAPKSEHAGLPKALVPGTPKPPPQPPDVSPAPAANPDTELVLLPDPPLEQFSAAVDRGIRGGQWAYLEHDARVATAVLLNHLPLDLAQADTRVSPVP